MKTLLSSIMLVLLVFLSAPSLSASAPGGDPCHIEQAEHAHPVLQSVFPGQALAALTAHPVQKALPPTPSVYREARWLPPTPLVLGREYLLEHGHLSYGHNPGRSSVTLRA